MTVLALRRRTHVERKVLLILRGDDSGWPQIRRGSHDGANTVMVPTKLPDRFELEAVKNIVDAKLVFERRPPFPDVRFDTSGKITGDCGIQHVQDGRPQRKLLSVMTA